MTQDLFPPLEPYASGQLRLDDIHIMYWEECGNPHGAPVLFLHGGPGAGATPTHRRFFDPAAYRIIIFDQRGAGRSTPLSETRNNTTDHLIRDIELLRADRGVARWHVFGGSWGSTLAIAYAEACPDVCVSLTLRGICLMQKREIDWFLYGIRNIYPEPWRKFADFVAPETDLLAAYNKRFADPDLGIRLAAARAWADYESSCSELLPNWQNAGSQNVGGDDRYRLGIATIEAHYFTHNLFTPDDKLLRDVGRIRHIPAMIVQGRYDMVCPIITADELHAVWPEAEYKIVPDAGHSALEPGISAALVRATEKFKTLPLG